MTANGVQMFVGSRRKVFLSVVTVVTAVMMMLLPWSAARAANTTWSADTGLYLSGPGITLTILSGSNADSLSVTSTTFTVTVAAGETFTVRYPGPNPGNLANDGGLTACQYSGGNNQVAVNGGGGGVTVTFTPTALPECTAPAPSGGGGSSPIPASATVVAPNGGQSWNVGETKTILWSAGGTGLQTVRLKLSTDGGSTFPTIIAAGEYNDGAYNWTIPSMTTTETARVRVEALGYGDSMLAYDMSDADFTINGTAPAEGEQPGEGEEPTTTPPPASDSNASGHYSPSGAADNTPDIDTDKDLEEPAEGTPGCEAGSLIKGQTFAAVYYCGRDGKRYVFPNEKTFYTWYDDFSSLVVLTDAELAAIPLGGNATYKPGVRMVKIQTDPKVYAIARGGLLRWVQTEAVARALYGDDWNQKIDDVSDAFFVNYTIGDPITEADL